MSTEKIDRKDELTGEYVEIRKAAKKGAIFNDLIESEEDFPYISDERIARLSYRLAREYRLGGFTEGLLLYVFAFAPESARENDDEILKLARFYASVETARNDTDRKYAIYF